MLCSFTVANYKSYKEPATLCMEAASIKELSSHILKGKFDEEFLPVGVIYGPNGGGKSNILSALKTLISLVISPIRTIKNTREPLTKYNTDLIPFAFSKDAENAPIDFELVFESSLGQYRYQISVKDEIVLKETLEAYKFSTARKSMLFTRCGGIISKNKDLRSLKTPSDLSAGLPFLSYLGIMAEGNKFVDDVIGWFKNQIDCVNFEMLDKEKLFENLNLQKFDQKLKSETIQLLQRLDLNIVDIEIDDRDQRNPVIYAIHSINDEKFKIDIRQESRGIQKLFSILPGIVQALNIGRTLVVDELDTGLHPVLLQFIISLFTDNERNKNKAQLIFTSQDVINMNKDNFRRDEIWFAAKNGFEESQIYSLAEFKKDNGESVRNDAAYFKQYLEGTYGADPFVRKNWG